MTDVPLLETKLHMPRRRRDTVVRPRLHARLDPARLPALTLVSAPAGFGKTTLLAEGLASAGRDVRVAWVSLDRRDNDPHLFWSYAVAAVRAAVAEAGSAASLLEEGTSSLEVVLTTLLNDLGRVKADIVLVLDDFHLIEAAEVQDSVRFLVENLPPQAHLVLASRADPPWPLAGLRARGELLELRGEELRFTAEEAAAYLNGPMDLALTAGQVDALEARTEGWVAALQLAALSLRGRDDVAEFIAGFAGDDRFILDYLVDEVLDHQTADIRRFLLRTSILSRLTAPLCDALTGATSGKATLDALERANLFLIPLDDRRVWYRYHHLFADVLHARLLDEEPGLVVELHRAASEWLERSGERAEAIRHSLAAEDFPRAAELIELAVPTLRQARQEATLRAWFDALPPGLFADRPVLTIGMVGARMSSGDLEGIEALLDEVERWIEPSDALSSGMVVFDEAELARLPAQAATYRAALALLSGDTAGTIAHARRVLELTAPDDLLGQGAAAALLGLAHWAIGDLETAELRYAESVRCFEKAAHHADLLGCSRALADIQAARGRLGDALDTLESGVELARAHGPLRGAADMHAGLAELLLERNDLGAAAEHVDVSAELDGQLALPQNAYRWRVARARLLEIEGDHLGALELLAEADELYDTDYSPPIKPVPATTARLQVAHGDLASARRWARSRDVAIDDELTYLREYEHLTLVRLLLAEHRTDPSAHPLDPVLGLLDRLLLQAEAGGRTGSAIEVLVLRALAHEAAGDLTTASATLDDALRRAEPEGYIRVFLDEGAPMTALLEIAARRGGPATEQARRVLAAGRAAPAAGTTPGPGRRTPRLVEELSGRELEVLRLLRTDLSGPDIARELVVSLNTVRTHTKSIYMKLGVNSRRAAVRRAGELGL